MYSLVFWKELAPAFFDQNLKQMFLKYPLSHAKTYCVAMKT